MIDFKEIDPKFLSVYIVFDKIRGEFIGRRSYKTRKVTPRMYRRLSDLKLSIGKLDNKEIIKYDLTNPILMDLSVPHQVRSWCEANGFALVKKGT